MNAHCMFIALTLLCFAGNAYSQIPANLQIATDSLDTSGLRCGEVLNRANGGGIFYKPFEQVLEHERCIWIVSAQNATGFTVNLLHLGSPTNQPGSKQQLIISGVSYPNFNQYDPKPNFTSYQPTSVGPVEIPSVNLLLVTFVTSEEVSNSTGFVLQYQETVGASGPTISENSMHQLFDSPFYQFKYPVGREAYSNKELTAFVFPPKDNVYRATNSIIWYEEEDLEDYCNDFLLLYRFNILADKNEIWQQDEHMICRSIYAPKEFIHDDLMLLLFVSDESYGSYGFNLTYVSPPI